jgi:hypothetical protein
MELSQSSRRINSTILSKSLRDARRAGLKTTISQPNDRAIHAAKMAMLRSKRWCEQRACRYERKVQASVNHLNVLPKRRGVLISTSDEHLSHLLCFMIAGREVAQSFL